MSGLAFHSIGGRHPFGALIRLGNAPECGTAGTHWPSPLLIRGLFSFGGFRTLGFCYLS